MTDWRSQVRRRQAARRFAFSISLALLFAVWLMATGLAWWAHTVLLGPPSGLRVLAMYLASGGGLSVVFQKWGPTLPFRGRAPEEEAARAFFAGEDVRSDDEKFEPGLEP